MAAAALKFILSELSQHILNFPILNCHGGLQERNPESVAMDWLWLLHTGGPAGLRSCNK